MTIRFRSVAFKDDVVRYWYHVPRRGDHVGDGQDFRQVMEVFWSDDEVVVLLDGEG